MRWCRSATGEHRCDGPSGPTAAQLRINAPQLSMRYAKLREPGDIVIGRRAASRRRRLAIFWIVHCEYRRCRLAVALHYDKKGAPRVVAKGKGTVGGRSSRSPENDIPIQENEVLRERLPMSNSATRFPPNFTRASRKS